MRFESRTWFGLSLLFLAGAVYFWHRGNEYQRSKSLSPARSRSTVTNTPFATNASNRPGKLLSQMGNLQSAMAQPRTTTGSSPGISGNTSGPAQSTNGTAHRLTNTDQSLRQLARNDTAILMRNALIDTARGTDLPIPEHLRASGDPASYIVQANGPIQAAFRARLQQAGAAVVSYIPNNAYLVEVSAQGAGQLAVQPEVQAVLPYQPYYKLDSKLLALAADQKPLGQDDWLRVTAFPDQRDAAAQSIVALGGEVLGEEPTPFGPQLLVKPTPDSLAAVARLTSVQTIERFHPRKLLNDRTRPLVGVATNGSTAADYLNLTGTNILVNINDSGIDATHPDLQGRIFGESTNALTDFIGHGTHVAGIIAGNGSQSGTISGTPIGSETNANYRGMAPAAQLFSMVYQPFPLPNNPLTDTYLAEAAARTNVLYSRRPGAPLISNNSWGYVGANEYDSSSARFDAAVRNAIPDGTNAQPMIFVFAAGNSGEGNDNGLEGNVDTIPSPANGKNVIAVGALESFRNVTNSVLVTNLDETITTNAPFLGMTDSSDEVAAFSSRGNVGIAFEGDFGRFKPDLVAPGAFIISTRSKDWQLENDFGDTNQAQYEILREVDEPLAPFYRFESGTSQAAPTISGLLALMQEFFEQRLSTSLRRTNSPALMKALLINGARSLAPLYSLEVRGFANFQGWGLANLTNSLPSLMATQPESRWPIRFFDQSATNALATGQSKSWNLNLSTNAQQAPLRITLVWTDPPGNPNAAFKLVNNLDLVVSNTVTHEVYYGNNIGPESDFNQPSAPEEAPALDFVNNVENVYIRTPASSNFVVSVIGRRVNVTAAPDYNQVTGKVNDVVQDYALVISCGDTTLTDAFTVSAVSSEPAVAPFQWAALTNGVFLFNQRVGANPSLLTVTNGITNQWNFYVFTNIFITNSVSTLTNGSNVAFITFLAPNVGQPRNSSADIDLYVSKDPSLTNLTQSSLAGAWKSLTRGGTESVVFTNAALGDVYYIGVKSEDQQAGEYSLVALSSNQPFEEDRNGTKILHGLPVPQPIPDGSAARPGRATVVAVGITPIVVSRAVVQTGLTHEDVGDLALILSHERANAFLHNHTLNNGQFSVTNALFTYNDSGFGALTLGARRSDGPGSLNDFVGSEGNGVWLFNAVDNAPGHVGRIENLTIELTPFQNGDLANAGLAGIRGNVLPNDIASYFTDVPPEATNMIVHLSQTTGPLEVYVARGSMPTTNVFDKFALIPPPGGDLTLGANDEPFPLGAGRYVITLYNRTSQIIDFTVSVTFQFGTGLDVQRTLTITNAVPLVDNGLITSTLNLPVDKEIADVQVAVRIDHPRSSDLVLHLISPQGTRIMLAENRGGIESRGYGTGTGTNLTYTIFTEDTNRPVTLEPVKFVLPPWPDLSNTATNPPVFSEDFETARPDIYLTNESFASFTVTSGDAVVHTSGEVGVQAHSGTNFVEVDSSAGRSAISTTFPTVPGKEYVLSFRYQRYPSAPAGTPHSLQIYHGPPAPVRPPFTSVDVRNFAWDTTNIIFKAFGDQTQLEFSSTNTFGPLLDSIRVIDVVPATNTYVLPEEPLSQLKGERAMGDWKLEILDDRSGPPGAGPGSLIDWQLLVKYGTPASKANVLANGIAYSGTVSGDQTNYFVVDVCESATVAFAALTGPNSALELLVNRNGLPTGDPDRDDFAPLTNSLAIDEAEETGIATILLSTNVHHPAPLVPGKKLFFAVHNLFEGETNTFDFQVTFDRDTCGGDRPVIVLENDVPYTNVVAPSAGLFDYYVFNVSPTAMRAQFEVTPRNGDVGMVLRYGLPLPVLTNFDYLSDRVGLTNELIVLTNTSSPVPLLPGEWYIGVYNNSTNSVVYNVRASEVLDTNFNVVILTNGIPLNYTLQQGSGLTNYFLFKAPPGTKGVKFELYNLNGNADLLIGYNRLPTGTNIFMSNSASPSQPVTVQIQTNAIQPQVSGNWVLSVLSKELTNLQFTLRATLLGTTNQGTGTNRIFNPDVTVTSTNICLSWPATVGFQYRLEGKETVVDSSWDVLYGPVTATNTSFNYCLSLPSPYSFFQVVETQTGGQTNQGGTVIPEVSVTTNDVCLTWDSQVGTAYQVHGATNATDSVWSILSDWIVATNTTTRFCISQPTPYRYFIVYIQGGGTNQPTTIIPLQNDVAYTNTVSTNGILDYYVFNVSPGAVRAQFLLQPTNGDAGMVLRYGLPLPVLTNSDYLADLPGITNDLIVLTNSSSPVPLQPGDWYIGVFNHSTNPVTYSVRATETIDTNLNLIPLTNGVPLNFTIGQGALLTNYFVFKATNQATNLQFKLYNLTANADLLIGLNQLPNYNNFFIGRSGGPTTPVTVDVTTNATLSELTGNWVLSVVNKQLTNISFTVQATLSGISTNNPPPVGTNSIPATLGVGTNGVCLSWPSQIGSNYVVLGKVGITDPAWTNLSGTITATVTPTTYCLPTNTPYHFFVVVLSGGGSPETPPSTNSVSEISLTVGTNGPCVSWVSQIGSNYVVAGRVGIADPAWTNVSGTITATATTSTYCLPTNTPYHFFTVFLSGGGSPETPPSTNSVSEISLTVGTNAPCVSWASQTGSNYVVAGKVGIADPAWTNVSGTITATATTSTYCLPTNTPYHFFTVFLSGGGGGTPETPPSTNGVPGLSLVVGTNGPCLSWTSQIRSNYVVGAKIGITDPSWTNVSGTITASTTNTSYCLPKTTPYHFFIVMASGASTPGSGGGTGSGGSTNQLTLQAPAILAGGRLQFAWPARTNVSYEVQVTTNLAPIIRWVTLTNIAPTNGTITFTDSSRATNGATRFYQVVEHVPIP